MKGRTMLAAAAAILAAALSIGCLGDGDDGGGGAQDNGLVLTVNSEEDPWIPDNELMMPDEGLKLVRYNVTVENRAGEAADLSTLFFGLTTEKGNVYTPSLQSDFSGPSQLADGASYTMSVVFEIEEDDSGATLRYESFDHQATAEL